MSSADIDNHVLAALHALVGAGEFLQGKGLVERVAKKAKADPVEAKMSLGRLARNGVLEGVSDRGEIFARVRVLVAAPKKENPALARWTMALTEAGMSGEEIASLSPCHDRLDDFAAADLLSLANGLIALRSKQSGESGKPRFVVSALHLLGSSKILGSLPPQALRAFGIDIESFPDAIPHVVVAGPPNPTAVVLIENPHSFDEAVLAGCADRVALVATFGYGLSRSGEAYGNQLVESLGFAASLVPLIRTGNPPAPAMLFEHPNILFWGDLDREGLRIYASLKSKLPALRLSALYGPMVAAARSGKSHPYAKATAKEKQNDTGIVPDDAVPLVPVCRERGVDQEIVSREDIVALITQPFSGGQS